ncbi:hypothetical protein CHLNCDRAFT_24426 [Chlorella variabilis]|uniref:N-alpha-acetyltransferase 40 n=1 Tax=Chlorella variabilis TaxID=554065 RepID=E1ZI01_CHLVA|nr:hypothetical protein CHLNCDRAFT_24426 [Chlorella variabilis]EFN54697.1 hypothetical protein CHLNCDRAFT_24426 [Chlorella variabilis]|eukprot:XP_005846799.1 hypothetical protein CHLNCDRAFT_24426 [Chlorella variabilis]
MPAPGVRHEDEHPRLAVPLAPGHPRRRPQRPQRRGVRGAAAAALQGRGGRVGATAGGRAGRGGGGGPGGRRGGQRPVHACCACPRGACASAAGVQLAAQYPAFQRYDRKGLAAALRFYGAAELPPAMVDWALDLTRHHMSALYEACPDWGWSDARKRGELADPAARHLVLGQPVAFVHFRFEEEEGEAVLYCYEIQVAAAVQGKGLGRFLMQLLELVGRKSGVARLMLTVFHQSAAAVALYRKLG